MIIESSADVMTMRLERLAFVLAAVVALAAPIAAAAPGGPPPGKVYLGVVGPDPQAFDQLTGRHHPLHVLFGNWTGPVGEIVNAEHADGRLPVLSLPTALSPADVARGAEDARWIALSQQLNGTRQNVWVRIFPEMTGYWNAWCAFDESGRPRGAKYSTTQFVLAFRRVAIILRGGSAAQMNVRLVTAGVPALKGAVDIPASGRVGIVWNPQGHGVPYIAANGPDKYWPGPGYVDIVGDDMYSDSGEPSWQGMDTLYSYGKPFLVDEWGLKGSDDRAFAQRMFDWIPKHPRTVGVVYFNKGWSGGSGIFELRAKPRSLALYRARIRDARYLSTPPPG